MYIYIYIYIYIYTHTHTHTYIHTYIHIHTYVYTHAVQIFYLTTRITLHCFAWRQAAQPPPLPSFTVSRGSGVLVQSITVIILQREMFSFGSQTRMTCNTHVVHCMSKFSRLISPSQTYQPYSRHKRWSWTSCGVCIICPPEDGHVGARNMYRDLINKVKLWCMSWNKNWSLL